MKSFVAFVAAVALAAPLSGCGSDDPAPASSPADSPSTSATTASVSVVVIGDSIPYNASEDCPECTSFADSYGAALGEELDTTVEVANRSRHDGARTSDILDELVGGGLTEPLASADVVVVSVGFNDQPPYVGPGKPCYGAEPATAEEAIDAVAAMTTACVDEVTATVRQTAADALGEVRTQAPEAAIAALVPYDSWNGWSLLDARPAKQRQAATRVVKYALETWRDALCAEVAEIDGVCVDVYREFNGPDGGRPAGDLLAEDYTHPSQKGNDLIRDLLLEARLLG